MHNLDFLQPPNPLIRKFEAETQSMLELMANLIRRNAMLRQARDLFLPRPISGELPVDQIPLSDELGLE